MKITFNIRTSREINSTESEQIGKTESELSLIIRINKHIYHYISSASRDSAKKGIKRSLKLMSQQQQMTKPGRYSNKAIKYRTIQKPFKFRLHLTRIPKIPGGLLQTCWRLPPMSKKNKAETASTNFVNVTCCLNSL